MVNQKLETMVEFLFLMVKTHTILDDWPSWPSWPLKFMVKSTLLQIRHFLNDIPMFDGWNCQFSYFHSGNHLLFWIPHEWIGLREKIQEPPLFHRKNKGFHQLWRQAGPRDQRLPAPRKPSPAWALQKLTEGNARFALGRGVKLVKGFRWMVSGDQTRIWKLGDGMGM